MKTKSGDSDAGRKGQRYTCGHGKLQAPDLPICPRCAALSFASAAALPEGAEPRQEFEKRFYPRISPPWDEKNQRYEGPNVQSQWEAYKAGAERSPLPVTAEQEIWFHGTTPENAEIIKRDGFKVDTWFARHMEDAVKLGGSIVFFVKVQFDDAPLGWQVHSSNAIPATAIIDCQQVRKMPRTSISVDRVESAGSNSSALPSTAEQINFIIFSPYLNDGSRKDGICSICKHHCKSVKQMSHHVYCRALSASALPSPGATNLNVDDCGLVFTEMERTAIAEMSEKQELRPATVIKRALATYQLVVNGSHELREINPSLKLPSDEFLASLRPRESNEPLVICDYGPHPGCGEIPHERTIDCCLPRIPASPGAQPPSAELAKAFARLLEWLENDTLEIMKDTRKMGITFDSTDCDALRREIADAEDALTKFHERTSAVAPQNANFIAEVRPEPEAPSCHVCGAMMVPDKYKCLSCGARTGCPDEAVAPGTTMEKNWENVAWETKRRLNNYIREHDGDWPGDVEFGASIKQAFDVSGERAVAPAEVPKK